jgi:hypothetical protein
VAGSSLSFAVYDGLEKGRQASANGQNKSLIEEQKIGKQEKIKPFNIWLSTFL